MNKLKALKEQIPVRDEEIFGYQLNIDNFKLAINKIEKNYADNLDMVQFKTKLEELLKENQTEQLKAIIIRDVLIEQVTELEKN